MLYKAFISYSHAADDLLAPALQSALVQFAKPWYQLRTFKVFRDKTSLSANPALWPSIESALSESEFFILLASPIAGKSIWVRREVEWWLANRSVEKLFVVLTDGDLIWDEISKDLDWKKTTALPDNLHLRFEAEPLYVDLRWAKTVENLSIRNARFRSAILDLAAPLRGIPKDDLDGEDIRLHRKMVFARNIAVAMIMAFAVVATWQWKEATQQRDVAQKQEKIATARQLAAQAELLRTQKSEGLPRSVLLAIESFRRWPSPEAFHVLHEGVRLLPYQTKTVKHTDQIRSVIFSPDGQFFATGGDDGNVIIWNTETGKEHLRLTHHGIGVTEVAFSPDGKLLASACTDQTARIWDVTSGEEILSLYHKMERKGPVEAVAFSPNGQYLATGTNDFNAHVWELSTTTEVFRMPHDEAVNSVAFSPDSQYLATGSGNRAGKQRSEIAKGRGTVWGIPSKIKVIEVKLDNAVEGVAFASDGKSFATASWDNTARIWEISTGREVMQVNHPAGYVTAVDFSRDGRYLATGSSDKTARIWNLKTHKEITRITLYSEVISVNFSSNGNHLATASLDQSVSIWEPASQHEITRLPAAEFQLDSANSNVVAILLNNMKSEIDNASWDSLMGRRIDGISSQYIQSKSLLSPDGKYFYGLTPDQQTLNLVRTSEMEKSMSLQHPARVEKIAFNLTEELIATGSSDGRVRVWELATGREIQHFSGNESVTNISFNADNKLLAIGGKDRVVRVWEISTGRKIRILPQENEPSIIAFSPNGQHIATANGREEARVWNISSTKPYVVAQIYYEKSLKAINFSPAGKYLLTINGDPKSFDDDSAHFWLWNPDDLIEEACARLTRNLKQEEWNQYLPREENPRKTCTNLIEP